MIRTDSQQSQKLKLSLENFFSKNDVKPHHAWIDNIIFDFFFKDDSLNVHPTESEDTLFDCLFMNIYNEYGITYSDDDIDEFSDIITDLVKEIKAEYDKIAVTTDLTNATEITLKDGTKIPINQHLAGNK